MTDDLFEKIAETYEKNTFTESFFGSKKKLKELTAVRRFISVYQMKTKFGGQAKFLTNL